LSDREVSEKVNLQKHTDVEGWKLLFKKCVKGDDQDIQVSKVEVSLVCPLGQKRIHMPVRSINCLHLECFDLFTFMRYQFNAGDWECPICGCESSFENLGIDNCLAAIIRLSDVKYEVVEFSGEGELIGLKEGSKLLI
jgi:E3 SUMO-protein ligase PIAS1